MGIRYNGADADEHDFEEEAGAGGTTRPVHGLSASIVSIFTAIKTAVEATLDVADSVVAGKIDTLIGHVDGVEGTLSSILMGVATTLAGYLDGVEGKLDTLHTDLGTTLAGYLDGLEGYVDGLETKLDTLHTDLTTLAGYVDGVEGFVDGLEGFVDGIETKLDTLHTDLGTTLAGYVDGVESTLSSILTAVNTPAGGNYGTESIGTSQSRIDSAGSHACRLLFFQNLHASQDLHFGFDSSVATTTAPKLRPGEWHRLPIDNTNRIYFIASGATTTMRYYYLT